MQDTAIARDRWMIGGGAALITALGWAYLFYEDSANHCMRMMKAGTDPWTVAEFGLMFVMWAIMMVAMMVPSVTPTLMVVARVNRQRRERAAPYTPTAVFLIGYVIVWTLFSFAATGLQAWLQRAALVSKEMISTSEILSGVLLIGAGIFQWMPLKNRCLTHCHSPWQVLTAGWREGNFGALRMGIEQGAFCLGCCWAVMLLLFVAGVMNLLWVAAIGVFVLVEKLAPRVGRWGGSALMICAGLWTLVNRA